MHKFRNRPDSLETTAGRSLREERGLMGLMEILRQHTSDLSDRYKVKSLGVFGSYVHNKQRKGSDVDVLVEFFEPPSLFKFIELEDYLANLLGVKVDLVMRDALKPAIGRHILEEVVPV